MKERGSQTRATTLFWRPDPGGGVALISGSGLAVLFLCGLLISARTSGAQCPNIAGNWTGSEQGSVTVVITDSLGDSQSEADPISGSGTITITQTGPCTFQYIPLSLSGSALVNSSLTARTVTLNGDSVTDTGIFAVINTAAAAQQGITITSINPNVENGTGQIVSQTVNGVVTPVMTIKGTGNAVVKGTASSGGQTIDLTITITSSTTATLTQQELPITEVDPVPDLLIGPSVTTFVDLLASRGTPVTGVAADGVTQVLIRVPGVKVGDQLTFTLFNDQGQQSSSPTDDGALAEIGSTEFTNSNVTVTAVSTPSGPMGFALYRAPADFVRTAFQSSDAVFPVRVVSIQVQDSASSQITSAFVNVVRPPVALIHGNWSSPDDWTFFTPLASGNCMSLDDRFAIFCLDYASTMSLGIDFNAQRTFFELKEGLQNFKNKAKVAAVQTDVVGYSMGGLIARDWVVNQSLIYLSFLNYNSGDVHKLITIDTPHLGSQLATQLLSADATCKALFNIKNPIGQNIDDLAPTSTLLKNINRLSSTVHLPAQVIFGTANAQQTNDADNAFFNLTTLLNPLPAFCPGLLPAGGYMSLFTDSNNPYGFSDLVVPQNSQVAQGLSATSSPVVAVQVPESVIHTVNSLLYPTGPDVLNRMLSSVDIVQANPAVSTPNRVINALNTPVSSYQRIMP